MAGVSVHGGVETTASPRKGSPGYLKWYWLDQRRWPGQMEHMARTQSTPHQIHESSHGRPCHLSLVPRRHRRMERLWSEPSPARQTTTRQTN